jgi:hydrogenase-4 component C
MGAASLILIGVAQAVLLLLAAPLVTGVARVVRAKFHNRRGPPILQDYLDLAKLLARAEVVPADAGAVFRVTPYVFLVAMLLVGASIPALVTGSPGGPAGDLLAVIYLFALARFFLALAGIDSGSIYGGLGASREATLAVTNEPVMVLSLFVVAARAGSTNLGTMSAKVFAGPDPAVAATLAAMLAFAFAIFVEMGKVPLDLAEAETEVQEGPLIEYSGRALALLKWGLHLKQVVAVALFLGIFFPVGASASLAPVPLVVAAVVLLVKLIVVFVALGFVENTMARVRFTSSPRITFVGLAAALLAFAFSLAGL